MNEQIFSHIVPDSKAIVLEQGCGVGRNIPLILDSMGIDELSGGKVHAVDFSHEALDLAKEKLSNPVNVVFHKGNMSQLSFADETFNAVFDIFAGTYMPIKGWKLGVIETFRVMKPGGRAYFLYFIHGRNFGSLFKKQVIDEFFHNPAGLYWAMHLKLVRGLNVWDKFIANGDVVYPEWEELLDIIKFSGGIVEVAEESFLGACIFVRAIKS